MRQKITMSMVKNRSLTILECSESPKYNVMLDHVLEKYNYDTAKLVLQNWNHIHPDTVVAANSCLAVFESCVENETNPNHIIELGNIIAEGAVKKLRNGVQLNTYLKNKVARFKTKLHTKFNTRMHHNKNSITTSVDSINDKIKSAATAKVPTGRSSTPDKKPTKEDAILTAYQRIQSVVETGIVCDVIINNQAKLEKRFNVVKTIRESADMESAIISICEYIDTYNMGLQHKYNLALQNIPYSIYNAGLIVDQKAIAETVTDYFLLTSDNPDIETMQKVLEHNSKFIYNTKDIEGLSYMFKDVANLKIKFDDSITLIHEVDASKITSSLKVSKDKIKDALNEFKKSADKTPAKLKAIIVKSYSQTPEEILEEFPDILSIIRFLVILTSLGSINPILALIGVCTDAAIKIHFSRKQIDKYLEKHRKEIDKAKAKIENAKTDEDKEKFKKYKKKLEDELEKLKDYRDNLYTEKEAEDIRDKESDDDFDFGDDDDIFGDLDMSFDECTNLILTAEQVVTLGFDIRELTDKIAAYDMNYPTTATLLEAFTEYYYNVADLEDYQYYMNRVFLPTKALYESCYYTPDYGISESSYYRAKNYCKQEYLTNRKEVKEYSLSDTIEHYRLVVEGARLIRTYLNEAESMYSDGEVLQEGFKETLQAASITLKNAMQKLSDTEKSLSRTVDAHVNTFARAAERAFTNDNKEAVIKGSIIPSASKVIKIAIITGAAWAVQPALAVLGVLAYIGLAKTTQAKERQLILDEIDTELQMTEKYLRIAEDKNDMKATRQLLRTQRDLQRQRQRLRYRMKVYNQRTNLTGGNPSEISSSNS